MLFEIWRLRSAEELAIFYKGQHQYGASRRLQVGALCHTPGPFAPLKHVSSALPLTEPCACCVQDAVNEQVSCLLGMFLREPEFTARMQVLGGELANLFFKLQVCVYKPLPPCSWPPLERHPAL
jgi:hypothetical protein